MLVALHMGIPVPLAILVGMVSAGVLSVLVDLIVLSPLRARKAPEFSFVVATIGVSLVLATVLRWQTDAQIVAFPREGFPVGAFDLAGQNVPPTRQNLGIPAAHADPRASSCDRASPQRGGHGAD